MAIKSDYIYGKANGEYQINDFQQLPRIGLLASKYSDECHEADIALKLSQALCAISNDQAWLQSKESADYVLPEWLLSHVSSQDKRLLKSYYYALENKLHQVPVELPKDFLCGSEYRTLCFHALIGRALINSMKS